MASRVAGKIKLQSVDELLGVPEIAGTQEIEIGRIHAFPNHPFKVLDDEKMDTLVDSIRKNGILNPVIVRPDQSGNYEMISGHRRLHAARIVGLKKIPAIVKEMSDDEAIIKMVDILIYDASRKLVIDGEAYLPSGYLVMKSCNGLQAIDDEDFADVIAALKSRMTMLALGKYRIQAYQLG